MSKLAGKALLGAAAAALCCASPEPARSQQVAPRIATAPFTNQYQVVRLELAYGPRRDGTGPHPDLPPLETIYDEVTVPLRNLQGTAFVAELYVAPEPAAVARQIPLWELDPDRWAGRTPPVQWTVLTGDALVAIGHAIVQRLHQEDIYAVWVAPHRDQIDPTTGEDLRTDTKDLTLVISVAEIQRVRTVARGRRFAGQEPINRREHLRVLSHSPLHGAGSAQAPRGSLFRRGEMDDYLTRLNRFPGRRVDGALSTYGNTQDEFGLLVADYIVTEDRPWLAFAHLANTGTEASGDWRERFGYINQQLTNHDDILSLDYVTADFDRSHAAFLSYEFPLLYPDRLKAEVFGSYGRYDAGEVGLTPQSFEGSSWLAGAEFTWSPLRTRGFALGRLAFAPLFIDVGLGAKWQYHRVNNQTFGIETSTDLLLPFLNLNVSSLSQKTRLSGGVQFETNLPGLAGTAEDAIAGLGRFNTDENWILAKWGAGISFFLEPFFAPESKRLAHEVSFSGRGLHTFGGKRLPPQQQELVGGSTTVRGYPEAFALGDRTMVGSAEYHFYLTRLLQKDDPILAVGAKSAVQSQFANPFRFRAKDVYGRPQGDLMLRLFVDVASARNNNPGVTEKDRTLLSTGVGFEFAWRRNLKLRLDYGIVLRDEKDFVARPVESGDDRLHFSATMAY